jgi:hypothetical protein
MSAWDENGHAICKHDSQAICEKGAKCRKGAINRAPTVTCFVDGDAIRKKLDVFVFQVEALAEALHAASGVQKALLPRVEGMAL